MRTVTSSVPVIHGQQLMCSVKTAQPVPKEKVHQVLEAIYQAQIKAPVAVGDVVEVVVLEVDIPRKRISLSIKQA